jgi:hypothetical protein
MRPQPATASIEYHQQLAVVQHAGRSWFCGKGHCLLLQPCCAVIAVMQWYVRGTRSRFEPCSLARRRKCVAKTHRVCYYCYSWPIVTLRVRPQE